MEFDLLSFGLGVAAGVFCMAMLSIRAADSQEERFEEEVDDIVSQEVARRMAVMKAQNRAWESYRRNMK